GGGGGGGGVGWAPTRAPHAVRELDADEVRRAMSLLELQRYSLLMFTSCGWFFDELSRPEPVQVLRYAARAIQLAQRLTDGANGSADLEDRFVAALAAAPSNEARYGDGRGVYEQMVRPAVTDLRAVAAHFAISSLSWSYGETERIGAYEVAQHTDQRFEAGRAVLAVGRLTVRSVITLHQESFVHAVFHFGDHSFTCGVQPVAGHAEDPTPEGATPAERTPVATGGEEALAAVTAELVAAFDIADFPGVIHLIGERFGNRRYSLRTLFLDEQRRILATVLHTTLGEVEASYRSIYTERAPLMRYLADLDAQIPPALVRAAETVINADLRLELSSTDVEPHKVRALLDEAERFGVDLDVAGHAHALTGTIARLAGRVTGHLATNDERFTTFAQVHEQLVALIGTLLEVVELVPFEVDLAPAQDVLWRTLRDHTAELATRVVSGDQEARRWLDELRRAAVSVGVVPPGPEAQGPPR
ncbi:MAG: DUF3536 domain-containing protein, partial [Nitriliruptoraceae bacterium]|nr:DUF3536 domain-containing protein [Nitriliruptoraceae bacterium]